MWGSGREKEASTFAPTKTLLSQGGGHGETPPGEHVWPTASSAEDSAPALVAVCIQEKWGQAGGGGGEGGQPACSERTSSNTRAGHQDSSCLTKAFYKALQSSPLLTKPSFPLCCHSIRSAPSSEGSPAPSSFLLHRCCYFQWIWASNPVLASASWKTWTNIPPVASRSWEVTGSLIINDKERYCWWGLHIMHPKCRWQVRSLIM